MFYIRYTVDGQEFGLQCNAKHLEAAKADIMQYAGFQQIVSVEPGPVSTWYPDEEAAGINNDYCWMHSGEKMGGWSCQHPDCRGK